MDDGVKFILNIIDKQGSAWVFIIFFGWFLVKKFWPWVIDKWWPAQERRQDELMAHLGTTNNTLIELRMSLSVITSELVQIKREMLDIRDTALDTSQTLHEHRDWTKDAVARIIQTAGNGKKDGNGRSHAPNGQFVPDGGKKVGKKKTVGKARVKRSTTPAYVGVA